MKKLFSILLMALIAMSCEQELNFPVSCDVTINKYQEGVLVSSEKKTQEFYTPKTADELSKQYTGKARVLGKYDVVSTAKCKSL